MEGWLDNSSCHIMEIFLSILYAPFVYFALKFFDIQTVSTILFSISLIWFIFSFIKDKKSAIIPSFYLIISFLCFFIEEFMLLKILPLLISIFIALIFIISFIKKESILFYFIQKFKKEVLTLEEKEYIHKSTFFWILITILNVALHIWAYVGENINFWLFYSTVGGYLLIVSAGIVQYLHKNFIYKIQVTTMEKE